MTQLYRGRARRGSRASEAVRLTIRPIHLTVTTTADRPLARSAVLPPSPTITTTHQNQISNIRYTRIRRVVEDIHDGHVFTARTTFQRALTQSARRSTTQIDGRDRTRRTHRADLDGRVVPQLSRVQSLGIDIIRKHKVAITFRREGLVCRAVVYRAALPSQLTTSPRC